MGRRVSPPRASISRPFTAATRPETVSGSIRSTAAIRLRKAWDLGGARYPTNLSRQP